MKVFVLVACDVTSIDGKPLDPDEVAESTVKAIEHAILYGQNQGHVHELAEKTSILFDYAKVHDTDLRDEW